MSVQNPKSFFRFECRLPARRLHPQSLVLRHEGHLKAYIRSGDRAEVPNELSRVVVRESSGTSSNPNNFPELEALGKLGMAIPNIERIFGSLVLMGMLGIRTSETSRVLESLMVLG